MENGNKPTNTNGDKPTGGNSSFTWIDGIIFAVIICVGFGVIFLMTCDCIAEKIYTKWQVVAGSLSLSIFALLSIEKIWEKSDKIWKPHQSIRIGGFALASLLFTYVTLHEIKADTDIKTKIETADSNITTKIGSADTNITNAIGKADSNIATKIESADTNITNAIGKADSNIATKIESADTNITNAIGKADSNIATKIESADTNITNAIGKADSNIATKIESADTNITNAIGKADSNIATKIESADTNITNAIGKADSNIATKIESAYTNITNAIDLVHISIKSLEGKIAGQDAQYQKILEVLQQIRDSIRTPPSDTSSQKEEPQPQNGG